MTALLIRGLALTAVGAVPVNSARVPSVPGAGHWATTVSGGAGSSVGAVGAGFGVNEIEPSSAGASTIVVPVHRHVMFVWRGASVRLRIGTSVASTPIGPIRLDYGVGREGGRTHFSIGHSF